MLHSVIRRTPSAASSTVADPSTVTVRIESASTSDLNVQDVSTSSSSDDDAEDDDDSQRPRTTHRQHHRSLSATQRQKSSTASQQSIRQKHPSRLSADSTTMRVPTSSRPITAVSLPAKPTAYDNEWDLDSEQSLASSMSRRNPSCPSISPTTTRSKTPSPSAVLPKRPLQQAPPVFTTTSECLGDDIRPQMRREMPRRSQSLVKPSTIISDPSSPTIPLVFLTDDILLGSIRALQNERQLCRLSVDYLIDATNMRPDELARKANVGARLPCQCGHTHSRCTLTLEFDQIHISTSSSSFDNLTNTTDGTTESTQMSNSKIREANRTQLVKLFAAVNRFIFKAQQENKRILIYGFELTPNSPLAVIAIQYLMLVDEQITLNEAIQCVHRLFPVVPLKHLSYPTMEKRFQDYLKQLEKKNFPKNFISSRISGDGGSSSSGNDGRQSTRDLSWTEPSDMSSSTTASLTSWTTIPMPIVNDHNKSSQPMFRARSAWDS